MGQYKSYETLSLTRRLQKAKQQLIQLKAAQRYGTNQVQSYQSSSLSYNCITYLHSSDYGLNYYGSGTDILHLRFVGNKPSKTVIARLKFDINGDGYTTVETNYLKEIRGSKPNIVEWWVWTQGDGESSPSWSITVSALSNEQGKLELVESYSILSNYQWITGGYSG